MEFYQELLLTALVSVLIAFLVGKLVGPDDHAASSPPTTTDPISEHRLESRPAGAAALVVLGSDPIASNEAVEEPSVSSPATAEAAGGVDEARSERGTGVDGVGMEIVPDPDERQGGDEERAGSLLQGEDEWEGVERSELAELFGSAAAYADTVMSELSSDVQMDLYALRKVATEGPCYEAQPLPLKVSARAKWHAWQRLGNMNPDVAMELYISLLSHNIPGWMGKNPGDKDNDPPFQDVVGSGTPDLGSSLYNQLGSKIGSKMEDLADGADSPTGSELSRQGLAKTLFLNLLSPTAVRF